MPPQLNPIDAHEKTLGSVFGDSYEFEIPPYQRPYAWEADQVSALLNDLLEAMGNVDESGGVYFLGSIVLIKQPATPKAQVVDGQQRLTTLTILLSVLRDLTTDMDKKISRRAYVYQKADADRGTQERFRLHLRERDQSFFAEYVQKPEATPNVPDPDQLEGSQQRIAENARLLYDKLAALDEARRDNLVAFIIQRCYLVVVAVPTRESARRIFTVLNARGMDLTATDILKADLLERAGPEKEGGLARRWEAVEQATGRDEFVELFGHIRMIYERDKPRSSLETAFPKVVPSFTKPDNFITELLEPIADAYSLVENDVKIERLFGVTAATALRALRRIDNKDWLPPVLLQLWKRSQHENAAVSQFLVDVERLAYFLFVTRADVNERIARFAAVMDALDPRLGHDPGQPLALSNSEQTAFIEALSGPIYQKSRVCKPVLQRLDEALSSGGATYDQLISIEHVLPQTVEPGSEWSLLFPDEEKRQEWTHKIANLVFLTRRINTRASNWPFERKKREYFQSKDGRSPFVLTQGVLDVDLWAPDCLTRRQAELVSKLQEVWQLKPVASIIRRRTIPPAITPS